MKSPLMLRQAVPYLKQYRGKTIIVKTGGKVMQSPGFSQVISDVAVLAHLGIRVLFVFGAGPQFDSELEKRDISYNKVDGRRITTKEMLPIIQDITEADVEKIQQLFLEESIATKRIEPFLTSQMCQEESFPKEHYTGYITEVDTQDVEDLLQNDAIGLCFSFVNGYNCNADDIVLELARQIHIADVFFLTGTKGVLVEENGKLELLQESYPDEIEQYISSGEITGGMIPKVRAACQSAAAGVSRVHILSGLTNGTLLTEMFTEKGCGTMIQSKK